MKMPFGKHKGLEINLLAETDFNYFYWLFQNREKWRGFVKTELEGNFTKFEDLIETETNRRLEISIRNYEQDREDQVQLDSYQKDPTFWAKASPYTMYDLVRSGKVKVNDDQWKEIYYNIRKREE